MKPKHTVEEFLLELDNAAAKLDSSNGVIRLSFKSADINILKTILTSPSASAIGELYWTLQEPISVDDALHIPQLCCNLVSLVFKSDGFNVLDLSTAILNHATATTGRLRMLTIHSSMSGDDPTQFFSALNKSQVTYLDLSSMFFTPQGVPMSEEFVEALQWYLAQDRLEVLHLAVVDQDNVDVLRAIRDCRKLREMQLSAQRSREFGSFALLPRSLTRLELNYMTFAADEEEEDGATVGLCIFLRESNVTHFAVRGVKRLNGDLLAEALMSRSANLQQVAWFKSDFRPRAAQTILDIAMQPRNVLRDLFVPGCDGLPFLQTLSHALQHENCKVERLRVDSRCAQIEGWTNGFIPALRHENCKLVHLILTSCYAVNTQAAHGAKLALAEFSQVCKRKRILVLLSSQQVRRLSARCALRRLPVEMMRLVGAMVF